MAGSYAKGVGVGVAVQQGCNLWVLPLAKRARPTAYVSSWIPSVTPANYNLHLLRFVFKHIRDDEGEEEKEMKELLIPRSRRAFFHPAAGLMGSEGLRRLQRLISHH